jgi:hypothetical protein
MKNKFLLAVFLLLFVSTVSAASTVLTDRLNFWDTEQHTIIINNGEGSSQTISAVMPTGFTFVSSSTGCTNPSGQNIQCLTIANGADAIFIMASPNSGVGEYEVMTMTSQAGSTVLPDVKYVRIQDKEIFLTLVEYGRGKSDYFYSSNGKAGSGQEETGYPYIPFNQSFELNYLHKIYPTISNYLGVPTAEGNDLSLSCTYPNDTVTKKHLATGMVMGATQISATYATDLLTNSWERLFWLTQEIDAGNHPLAGSILINCTNINYVLPVAYGNVTIQENSFNLILATTKPLSVSAASSVGTINNGTSEVDITYTFTNNGPYPLSGSKDPVRISIKAPTSAEFIGVKGELFGTSQTQYDLVIPEIGAGETYITTLTARFNTATINDVTVALSQGIVAEFVPTWENNAYNPMIIQQALPVTQTITISYATQTQIKGVVERLTDIETKTDLVLTYVSNINSTSTTILTDVQNLQTSVNALQNGLSGMNTTVNIINGNVNTVLSNTNTIINQLDCNGTADTPICQYVLDINNTVGNLNMGAIALLNEINATTTTTNNNQNTYYNNIQSNFTQVYNDFSTLQLNLSDIMTKIDLIQDYLDCTVNTADSVCYRLGLIENYVANINSTVDITNTNLINLNNTVLPNMQTTIINAINNNFINQTTSLTALSTQIRQVKEFNEESIYLITDSVVQSQQDAYKSFKEGDLTTATENIKKTNDLLNQLNVKLEENALATPIGFFGTIQRFFSNLFSWNWG